MKEGKTILVVDNAKLIRNILRSYLKEEGYDVILANNGKEALKYALGESPPDLIIAGVIMPEMAGYEMLKQLRESDVTKEIPVIFLTGNDQKENIKKGIEFEAHDYIIKPFKFVDLYRKIERFISKKFSGKSTLGRSKRKFKRIDTQLKAKYFLEGRKGDGEECAIINVSRRGMGIKFYTREKINIGLTVHLEIFVSSELEAVNVKGTLKNIRQMENDLIGGIELTEFLDEDKWTKLVKVRKGLIYA